MLTLLLALAARAEDPVPSLHRVPSGDDGYEIALARYETPGGPPVVLCHGISSNSAFWDLAPDRSLALWLHERGYDVWNLDLRGHGRARLDGEGRRQRPGWSVDDYGTEDLPSAFSYVLDTTGASDLAYVGHSMGGMVLAIYLANTPEPPLSSAIVVGSPLDFRDPDRMTDLMLRAAPFATGPGFLATPAGGRVLASMGDHAPLHADEFLYNPANIADPEARRLMLRNVTSPLSRGEIRQFGRIRKDGEFVSSDGTRKYRELLGEVRVPMMFFAGRVDRVVNPDRVFSYYEAVGSPDKEFVLASVANGMHGDYGHLDLGLGDYAEEDIFTPIGRWLGDHPSGAPVVADGAR